MNAIQAIALSMKAGMEAVDRISQNMANTSTPGFKRLLGVQTLENEGVRQYQTVDLAAGALKPSDSSLDVAIEGPAFFEVRSDQGVLYTRRGDFRLDEKGRLVTQSGFPVMGQAGEIKLQGGSVSIDQQGQVFENDKLVDRLRLVTFKNTGDLQHLAGSYYAGIAATSTTDASIKVRQGFLEGANVQTTNEMVQLVQQLRSFETGQRLIQARSSMQDNLFTKLGTF